MCAMHTLLYTASYGTYLDDQMDVDEMPGALSIASGVQAPISTYNVVELISQLQRDNLRPIFTRPESLYEAIHE